MWTKEIQYLKYSWDCHVLYTPLGHESEITFVPVLKYTDKNQIHLC